MDRGGWGAPLRDQRAELRSLQNMRHQGPEPEHHLGSAGGRWRAELSEHVNCAVTMLPLSRPKGNGHIHSGPLLRSLGRRAKPINAAALSARSSANGVD